MRFSNIFIFIVKAIIYTELYNHQYNINIVPLKNKFRDIYEKIKEITDCNSIIEISIIKGTFKRNIENVKKFLDLKTDMDENRKKYILIKNKKEINEQYEWIKATFKDENIEILIDPTYIQFINGLEPNEWNYEDSINSAKIFCFNCDYHVIDIKF
jgi:hypothetical protein